MYGEPRCDGCLNKAHEMCSGLHHGCGCSVCYPINPLAGHVYPRQPPRVKDCDEAGCLIQIPLWFPFCSAHRAEHVWRIDFGIRGEVVDLAPRRWGIRQALPHGDELLREVVKWDVTLKPDGSYRWWPSNNPDWVLTIPVDRERASEPYNR